MPPRSTRRSLLGASLVLGLAGPAWAQDLAAPTGRVILSISGKIARRNAPDAAQFDLPMLEALGAQSFTTTTPWHNGPVTFEGVPMARLLREVIEDTKDAVGDAAGPGAERLQHRSAD